MIKIAKTITDHCRIFELVILWTIVLSIQFTVATGGARVSFNLGLGWFGVGCGFDLYSSPFHR